MSQKPLSVTAVSHCPIVVAVTQQETVKVSWFDKIIFWSRGELLGDLGLSGGPARPRVIA